MKDPANTNPPSPSETAPSLVANECSDTVFLVGFAESDLGHAKRWTKLYGGQFRYCLEWKIWLWWNSKHWQPDQNGLAMIAAKALGERYRRAARRLIVDPKELQQYLSEAKRMESRGGLNNILALAANEPGIPVSAEELDSDPMILNVQNGTLDLRDCELRPHCREDLTVKILQVEYDPNAMCPTWLAFLNRIFAGDQELIAYVQRVLGYILTGDTGEQVLFIFYGPGANGKSTMLSTLLALLGPHAANVPMETLMVRGGYSIPNDLARLKGVRLAAAAETEDGQHFSESKIKSLTGQDRVAVRFLFKEFFDLVPQFKVVLAANHLPQITSGGHAIWRRMHVIPFNVIIPDAEQDKSLLAKLKREWPGILQWMVEGCVDWQISGLNPPPRVLAAADAYREEMDVIGEFLEVECVLGASLRVSKNAVYSAYKAWCERSGERQMEKRAFNRRLDERGLTTHRGTAGARFWLGLNLLPRSISLDPDDARQFRVRHPGATTQ